MLLQKPYKSLIIEIYARVGSFSVNYCFNGTPFRYNEDAKKGNSPIRLPFKSELYMEMEGI